MWQTVLLFFSFNFAFFLISCNRSRNTTIEKNVNQKKVSLTPIKNKVIKKDGDLKEITELKKKENQNIFEPVLNPISENIEISISENIEKEIIEELTNNSLSLDSDILDYLNNSEFTKTDGNLIYYSDSINNTVNIKNKENNYFNVFIDSSEDLKWPKGIEIIEYLNSENNKKDFKNTSLLVADNDNYVWEFYGPDYGITEEDKAKRGKYRGIYCSGKMENPQDIVLTPNGELLVASADNHRILCYAGPNQENPGEFKKELFSLEESNGKPSKMYLNSKENKLYVKDSVNNKIETFNFS